MYTTATFRNNLTIEGLNPLRVACVAALKAKGERGNWVRESTKGARGGGKTEKEGKRFPFSTSSPARIPDSPFPFNTGYAGYPP